MTAAMPLTLPGAFSACGSSVSKLCLEEGKLTAPFLSDLFSALPVNLPLVHLSLEVQWLHSSPALMALQHAVRRVRSEPALSPNTHHQRQTHTTNAKTAPSPPKPHHHRQNRTITAKPAPSPPNPHHHRQTRTITAKPAPSPPNPHHHRQTRTITAKHTSPSQLFQCGVDSNPMPRDSAPTRHPTRSNVT